MRKNYKNTSLLSLILITLSIFAKAQTDSTEAVSIYGFYAYFSSLKNVSTASELTIQGNASHTSTGVQLTPKIKSQFGGLYIDKRSVTSVNGLHVEFEYDMKGGVPESGKYGDGLSFFLYDGAITNPAIGARGAGLGYSFNRANNKSSDKRQAGLTGAYLGIALDQFGNFKHRRFQGESRINGIPQQWVWDISEPSHITLRGARGKSIDSNKGQGDGFTGYPLLITQSTLANGFGKKLNPNNGNFEDINLASPPNFELRNQNNEFRKVYMDLIPHFINGTTTDGFDIKVSIQNGENTSPIDVINYYHYKTSVTYIENANPKTTDYNESDDTGDSTTHILNANVPTKLKLGFAASTGESAQQHIIRNVKLTLPYSAITNDDTISTCKGQPVQIPVLENDIAYRGPISITNPPIAHKDYIDLRTFSFEKGPDESDGTPDLTLYRKKVTSEGTWIFNKNTGIVTFIPSNGFTGTANMTYSVKGFTKKDSTGKITEPFGDTAYRSIPSTITVNLKTTGCTSAVISNKMVTQDIK
ncbi:Ig-like domain-containing protein [Chryseobacterium oryctis]|uniref:Inverse autotransporter beta-domain domain-containing protein n=1 Tax=Chryseobacterium oryctis TaxID=2952618 RepID=A0ABT3HJB6_9FLAO|nr:hypothetical protein [Chryseobacterium oryctis]MCW3159894.1 hypothetical protein [Chryseobacterium oryctis]